MNPMHRKQFLVVLAGGVAAVATSGCGGGGGDGAPAPQAAGGCRATIAGNHGHVLSIPAADLDATTDRSYSIQGSADHSHTVTFTAAQLAQLKAGQMVAVVSSFYVDHQHDIGEQCA